MLVRIAREHERQSAVARYVAGRAEAVLESEYREHERRAGVVKAEDARDEAERCHDRAARDAGGRYREDAEEQAEEHHRLDRRNGAVENLRNRHDEEDFCQDGAAEVNVREERYAEVHHVVAERRLGLLRAAQSDGERRCGGHRSDGRDVGRTVVLDYVKRVLAGVDSREAVEQRHPDVVSRHDDEDDLDEYRELLRDAALVRERAEGEGDKERKKRNDYLRDYREDDELELLEGVRDRLRLSPRRREAEAHRKRERAHDGHYRRDVELEDEVRQRLEPFDVRDDGKVRDHDVAGCHREERRAYRRNVGYRDGDAEHLRSVVAEARNGRSDETDDDERDAEENQLSEDVADRDDDVHERDARELSDRDTCDDAEQQLHGQAG